MTDPIAVPGAAGEDADWLAGLVLDARAIPPATFRRAVPQDAVPGDTTPGELRIPEAATALAEAFGPF